MRSVPGAAMRRDAPGPSVARCQCGEKLMDLPAGTRVVRAGGTVAERKCSSCGRTTKLRLASDE